MKGTIVKYLLFLGIFFVGAVFVAITIDGRQRKVRPPDTQKHGVLDPFGATSLNGDAEKIVERPETHTGKESKKAGKRTRQIAPEALATEELDVASKQEQVTKLLAKGAEFFNKEDSLSTILNAFCHNPAFKYGELHLFLCDIEGTCLADGLYKEYIWRTMYDERDAYGIPYFQQMLEKARAGGGWIAYEWNRAIRVAKVQKLTKNSKDYVLSCGYYPFSKADTVVNIVDASAELFKRNIAEGRPKSSVFGVLTYPLGRFVSGDLYIYAMTFSGDVVAHGERSGLVGTNGWNYQDQAGTYVNREIVKKLKASEGAGVWVDYVSKRAPKKAYARKVTDEKGVDYFIACGYYPDEKKNTVIDLVRKGYVYVKGHGLSAAVEVFNDIDNEEYRYGDMSLFMYDLKGMCIAEGSNKDMVGRSSWNERDEDGRFYVREMIEKAKDGGGWVGFKLRNSLKSFYVELVDLGVGKYIIGSGLYPSTKLETMVLMARSAASYLQSAPSLGHALTEFTKSDGRFIRGDLRIFVLTSDGICLAFGNNHNMIWTKFFLHNDDSGVPVVKLFSDSLQRGPGTLVVTASGINTVVYIEEVTKNGSKYMVGSGFNL